MVGVMRNRRTSLRFSDIHRTVDQAMQKPLTRFVLISDTHNHQPELPFGDVLVHAGDLTMMGTRKEIESAMEYLAAQACRFRHVIFIGGNHDWFLYYLGTKYSPNAVRNFVRPYGSNILYLENEMVNVPANDGKPIIIYGSPVQPEFCNWAWNKSRGDEIRQTWDRIPAYHPALSIDILLTHGPAHNILDWIGKDRVGCEDLREALDRVQPKLHVFGHIHCAYGKGRIFSRNGLGGSRTTECYNAALCGEADIENNTYPLDPKHKPWVLDYDGQTFTEVPNAI